jgi:hypothetical protein
MERRQRWRSSALLAVVALGIGLTACGGGSSPGSSDAVTSACSPSGCANPAASASLEVMAVRFAGCVRAHGVPDFPDPTIGSNGLPSFNDSWSMNAKTQADALPAAQRACRKDLPQLGPHTSAERAAANAEALKYATCMRSNGVPNFPDPNGQGVIQINDATGDLDPNSPQFEKAATACKRLENGFGVASSVASQSSGATGGGS